MLEFCKSASPTQLATLTEAPGRPSAGRGRGLRWDKIEFLGLFTTQILSLNPGGQSKKRHNEKCRFLQKFRKVPINQLVFQQFCLEISCYHFGITVQLDIMSVLYFSHYKSLKKSPKFDSKIKKFQDG